MMAVHVLVQERLHGTIRFGDLVRQANDGMIERPDGLRGVDVAFGDSPPRLGQHIGDHRPDDLADPDMNEPGAIDLTIFGLHGGKGRSD